MRYATFAIKRFQWESFGRANDPGLLALAAGLYAGPLFYILTNTSTVHFVIWLNSVWVSRGDKMAAAFIGCMMPTQTINVCRSLATAVRIVLLDATTSLEQW
ncbi:hypothetical protein AC1031_018102 [Aphanomyces cochlioides]|nr:hypothetical protein AC1031_018102 [Aphanomyces cochlioides]